MRNKIRYLPLLALWSVLFPAFLRAADVTVAVDPALDRHPVSPLIYGVSFGNDTDVAGRRWTVRRWGGNSVTRYNWMTDVTNIASDWYFENYPQATPNPATLPDGSTADDFIDATRSASSNVLITVPTIGWKPKELTHPSGPINWGFSVARYGPQCSTDFWVPDAGNGYDPTCTAALTGNDPADTSVTADQSWAAAWVAHIVARQGLAAQGGVRFYALDNEPMLWNSTHRDVHPLPPTYDEIWGKTVAYATAIKAQDPSAKVMGPDEWGWCAYFWSALDGCSEGGPDLIGHGGLHWVDYYLQQNKNYFLANGVRLVDYLDLHDYPQGNGVAFGDDSDPNVASMRLRSIKSLYDPTYVDESWIGGAGWEGGIIRMIPRMKDWVANSAPGMKTAITEYNWGLDDTPTGALAQAEVLAIFGREGLDLATRWVAPTTGSLTQDAFDLYLNYDGAGSRVEGESVRAVSSNIDWVGSYALQSLRGKQFFLLFNKDTVTHSVDVSVAGGIPAAAVPLVGFEPAVPGRLGGRGAVTPVGNVLSLTLPARSARLAVIDVPAPANFYTIVPCRMIDTRRPAGDLGGPALIGGGDRIFPAGGNCGIPPTAKAISINLTAVNPGGAGDLRIHPGDAPVANASSINFRAGSTRANNGIVPLAANGDGSMAVRTDVTSGSVHLLVDVNGYFQ